MPETNVFSYCQHYHENDKQENSNNKNYRQDRKYPLQHTEAFGMSLENVDIILDIENLLYTFPKSFEYTCKAFKNFRNKNKEPIQKVTHVFLVFLSIGFTGQSNYSALSVDVCC